MYSFTHLILIVGLFATFILQTLADDPHYCLSQIPSLIENELKKLPRTRHALLFQAHDESGKETRIFEKNSEEFMTPASNNKILTTAASYIDLGVDFSFKTTLRQHPHDQNKYCLIMNGNPELSVTDLQTLVDKAAEKGKTLVLDTASFFGPQSQDVYGTWEFGDLPYYYSAQPVAASVARVAAARGVCNTFVIEVRPGAKEGDLMNASVIEPSGFPADFWRRSLPVQFESTTAAASAQSGVGAIPALGFEGVTIRGALAVGAKPERLIVTHTNPTMFAQRLVSFLASERRVPFELGQCYSRESNVVATVESPTSLVLMDHTLKTSDNTYTELYLRTLGAKYMDRNTTTTTAESSGLEMVQKILEHYLDVPSSSYKQFDGSGLSRWNLVSAESLVDTITGMYDHHREYITFFPEAGKSGTLSNRFMQYPGILRAKTGTITGTSSLSGIIYAKYFDHIVFSVIVNQSVLRASEIRAVIDDICIMVAYTDPSC
uniref:Serine-type D-Ala-D-Ala carboxypeptidase n=1 Tax=Percolomonas cosmopolitus TaxID=63605 RepID=A0A7S1PKR6_9EUKA